MDDALVDAIAGGWWWVYATQAPLGIYFLVSLLDTPLDVALQRLITCYGLPLLLLFLLSLRWYWGLALVVTLWLVFTSAVPFAPIRIPSGRLRKFIRRLLLRTRLSHLVEDVPPHGEMTNPFAVTAYIDVIRPIVFSINRFGRWLFGKPDERTIRVSEVAWLFLVINALGRAMRRVLGFNIIFPLARAILVRKAQLGTAARLVNEHDDTEKGVRLFLADLDRKDSPVSATGRLLMNNLFMGILDVRLSAQKFIKAHPDVRDFQIRRPIIVVGLPRTGSTFLLSLLAQDTNARHLRFWEMNWPVPPPEEHTYFTDARITQQDLGMSAIDLVCPTYLEDCAKNHVIAASTIEEELLILHHNFLLFSHYFLTGHNSRFSQWLMQPEGKRHAYKYMRMFLQLLSYKYPPRGHWVLKAPVHSMFIDTLLAEFPDACIVNTHREPKEVVLSWTKFQMQMLSIYCESRYDGTKEFAQMTLDMCQTMVDRVMAHRKQMDPEQERRQFFDVRIHDLSADPIGTVRRIYEHFDMKFTPEYEQRMNKYIVEHGTGDGGAKAVPLSPLHEPFLAEARSQPAKKVTLDMVGLDEAAMDASFAAYRAAYL